MILYHYKTLIIGGILCGIFLAIANSFQQIGKARWIILHQYLSPKELCGCLLMVAVIMLSQIPEKKPAAACS